MIESLMEDDKQKTKLFDTEQFRVLKEADWAIKWINDKDSSFGYAINCFRLC